MSSAFATTRLGQPAANTPPVPGIRTAPSAPESLTCSLTRTCVPWVKVRTNFGDSATLRAAFDGADRVLPVSGIEMGRRASGRPVTYTDVPPAQLTGMLVGTGSPARTPRCS